jgi:hypothetical protein
MIAAVYARKSTDDSDRSPAARQRVRMYGCVYHQKRGPRRLRERRGDPPGEA